MNGYQQYMLTDVGKGPRMTFEQWKKALGLVKPGEKTTAKKAPGTRAEEIAKAKAQIRETGWGALIGTL